MSKTISVRVEPVTGRKAAGQRRHDLRDPAHLPDYVDRSRTADNSVLIEPPDPATIRADIEAGRKAAGQQRLRADARTTVRGIITFGSEAQPLIERLSREQQDALYLRIATRLSKETGHDLIGLVVHRDESAPHPHFTLRGYRRDERGREMPWRHGLDMMRRLQDVAAQEVAGLGITRGTPKAERIARGDDLAQVVHRSVHELHRDLPAETEAKRRELEALERERRELEAKAQKNLRLIAEQEGKLEAGRVSEEQARKRMETYERRATEAKQRLQEIEQRATSAETCARDMEAKAQEAQTRARDMEAKAQEAAQEPDKRPIEPPAPHMVEVVRSKGVLAIKTERIEMIPAVQVRQYREQVERRQTQLIGAVVRSRTEIGQEREAHDQTRHQSDARARLLSAIARSPLADKVAEVVPSFRGWLDQVRERDGQERQRRQREQERQQKGRGSGLEL